MPDALEGDRFWARVYSFSQELEKQSPDGVAVVVEIITFDGKKFVPAAVQSSPPWLVCQAAKPGADVVSEILFLREADIRRVQVRSQRSGKPSLGFSVGDVTP